VAAVDLPGGASAVAAACGVAVFLCGFLPWYGLESTVRAGTTVELTVSLWGDERGDLLLALFLAVGIALAALAAATPFLKGVRPPLGWWISVAAAVCFLVVLLIVIARVAEPPGLSGTRFGAVVALILAIVATATAALAARLSRPGSPRSGGQPGPTSRRS
jgi:hypothetical protein